MLMRAYVDFSLVPTHQQDIDARLENWGKWSNSRAGTSASPMFRLYRSTDAKQAEPILGSSVDAIDAQRVQKGVTALPTKHRLAISWAYVTKSNPNKARQATGTTHQGLFDLITDARQMLINRGI